MKIKKRLTIEIDEKTKYIIKKRALEKNLSIKDWILTAITLAINTEDELNNINEKNQ